jgi:hypothetical protein
MKICFVPIDNRPVCYSLPKDIVSIDKSIEILMPPRELLGGLEKVAQIDSLFSWLSSIPECDAIIVSLDTLAYGGLIPSRRSVETFEDIKQRIENLKIILATKHAKIYAFSSIMRISNNNYNEEEKLYWSDYGKKIFEYSFSGGRINNGIPQDILDDYLKTRRRNFEINKIYLEWQKQGFFDTLIFSKDDCAENGFNVDEANELNSKGATVKTGADEIPLALLSRAIKKDIKVFVEFTEPDEVNKISNYEDVSIEKSVDGQLELAGFHRVSNVDAADLVLIVNNFIDKQGELVMGWDTVPYQGKFIPPNKAYAIADVRNANGADNCFVEQVLDTIILDNFYGYAGWNTSANTIGSLLAGIKLKWHSQYYDNNAFLRLQTIRFLDDWAYQANVRAEIDGFCDIKEKMSPFEIKLGRVLGNNQHSIDYAFPWSRKFEVEVLV